MLHRKGAFSGRGFGGEGKLPNTERDFSFADLTHVVQA
jgi:hypothetical protein